LHPERQSGQDYKRSVHEGSSASEIGLRLKLWTRFGRLCNK